MGNFKELKRQLLEWVARRDAVVNTLIALPYNPYHPQPYERFTVKGLLIPGEEMQVGEEFWNDLAGWPIYEDLLHIFNEVGKSLQNEVKIKIAGVPPNFDGCSNFEHMKYTFKIINVISFSSFQNRATVFFYNF